MCARVRETAVGQAVQSNVQALGGVGRLNVLVDIVDILQLALVQDFEERITRGGLEEEQHGRWEGDAVRDLRRDMASATGKRNAISRQQTSGSGGDVGLPASPSQTSSKLTVSSHQLRALN